jgi:hypothetical protein
MDFEKIKSKMEGTKTLKEIKEFSHAFWDRASGSTILAPLKAKIEKGK